jgi:hypothetical protein
MFGVKQSKKPFLSLKMKAPDLSKYWEMLMQGYDDIFHLP